MGALIEQHTFPEARILMNGGICERIFDAAKQALDARDDPAHPSVILLREDIRVACLAIPPAPTQQSDVPLTLATPVAPAAGMIGMPRSPHCNVPDLVQDKGMQACDASSWWNVWFYIDRAEG